MISIIISIFNVEKFLRECIASVVNQNYQNYEVILVDDGSTDTSGNICDEFKTKYSNIKVVHKDNGGLVSARKAGLLASAGSHILFLDGDDYIRNDYVSVFSNYIEMYNPDIICSCFTRVYNDSSFKKGTQLIDEGYYDYEKMKTFVYPFMLSAGKFFSFGIIPSVCTKCFKREIVLKAYESMDNRITLGEDAAISYPCIMMAKSIFVANYYGYMYRQNPNSMTHAYDEKLYDRMCLLLERINDSIIDKQSYNFEKQINDYTFALLIAGAKNEYRYSNNAFSMKKQRFNKYLDNHYISESIKKTKLSGVRNNIILCSFKHRLHFFINLFLR